MSIVSLYFFLSSLDISIFFSSSTYLNLTGTKAQTKASLREPSPTPTLNSSKTVLTIYFASFGLALVNNSAINLIFLSTVPIPSKRANFLRFSKTFFTDRSLLNKVAWLFFFIRFSATFPKSPVLLHSSSIFLLSIPEATFIAFIINLDATPILLSSQPGKILPCKRSATICKSSRLVFFKS